jgi:hypothetical protein
MRDFAGVAGAGCRERSACRFAGRQCGNVNAGNPEHLLDFHPQTDHLATSVMRSLSRSHHDHFSLSAVRAALLGVFTFGLVPLWRLQKQFRGYVAMEKQQLWHLAEWLRNRRGGESAQAVADAVSTIHWRRGLSTIGTLCFAVVLMGIIYLLRTGVGYHGLWDRAYRSHFALSQILLAWNGLLTAGFAFHYLQVRMHLRDIQRVGQRFNELAKRENVASISVPQFALRNALPWMIIGLVMAFAGALWAMPMALAALSQRTYVNETSARLRTELLDRMRAMMMQNRPAVAMPTYTIHGRRCGNALCRALLPVGAEYCPRCGSAATPGQAAQQLHEVA